MPISYDVIGAISSALMALLYNIAAKAVGGLEVDIAGGSSDRILNV